MANAAYSIEGLNAPKEDTLMNILGRIESLLETARKNETRLEIVRDRIGGATPQPPSDKPELQIAPSHAIFAATRIEQELSMHIDRVAGIAGRMERLV